MKCFFCHNELIDTEGVGLLDCNFCPNKTRYICSGSMTNIEVWYVHVRVDPYLVQWDLETHETEIYAGPIYKENKFIMKLEKPLPYDQQEVNYWVERIHNIKAFL